MKKSHEKTVRVQIEDKVYNAKLAKISEGMKIGVEFSIIDEVYRFWHKGIIGPTKIDEEFIVQGTKLRVVFFNDEMDIVQYGSYVSTQKPYTGFPKLTFWQVLLMLFSLLLPILTLGGKIPILMGLAVCALIFIISMNPFTSKSTKLLISLGLLVLAYALSWYSMGEFSLLSKLL